MFRCPRCSNKLFSFASDIDNKYLTCCACGRQFNFDGTPRAMSVSELKTRFGISLTNARENVTTPGKMLQ